jgi:hypothetical protein
MRPLADPDRGPPAKYVASVRPLADPDRGAAAKDVASMRPLADPNRRAAAKDVEVVHYALVGARKHGITGNTAARAAAKKCSR